MNGKSKTVKLSVMLILMIALMFSTAFMMIIKATEDTDKGKDAKFEGQYTIEYLIKHFNLVTLEDVSQVDHIVGPVLIGGDVKCNLCHSQITGGTSSYVKGAITGGNVSCNEPQKPTLYLGTKSKAVVSNNGSGTTINNQWYAGNPTVITDKYLDFDSLFSKIKTQSQQLASSGQSRKTDKEGKVEIKIGEKVIIEDLNNVKTIEFTGEELSSALTLINIKNSGTVQMPEVHVKGQQVSTNNSNTVGNAIVWNIPKATTVKMASSPSIGHIVAPSANVTTGDTNYAGCMIAKSLDGHIEGHFYAYNGIALPLKEISKEEPKDKNNTTGNSTTASKNNTTKPKNNTTGNSTTASKNNTTKPKNNTTGNSTTASKNNTTKPKNNTTGNSTTASKNNTTKPKNNTTKKNVAVANKTNKTNTSKGEDGMVLGAEWEKNNTSKNKTDKTTADGKLPQTGDEFSQKIVLGVVMIALVVAFGVKYIKHKNELDANK